MITFPTSEIAINVADFSILIYKSDDCPHLLLEEGYSEFQEANIPASADAVITAHSGFPEALPNETDLLYKATRDNQDFWSIYRHDEGYKLITYSQEKWGVVQQVALIDHDFKQWHIYSEPIVDTATGTIGVCPLEYPMGPLLFYYLTVRFDAIMIHASGIHDTYKGRLFSGFSGVGKSTMAKIWERNGSQIINDDRLIIRKQGDDYYIHNTPMPYMDRPKKAKLDALYLPYHAPVNEAQPLSPSKAVSKLLAYCIIHGYNKQFLEHHLDFLAGLSNNHRTTRIGVLPNDAIIEFIKKHESEPISHQ